MKTIKRMNIKLKTPLLIVFLLVYACTPLIITNNYVLRIINNIMLYSIMALSVNLIMGFCGMLDFGRSAFVGIGTYFYALVMTRTHVPFLVGFLGAALFSAIIGYILGAFLQRTSFDYFTLITCGFVIIFQTFLINAPSVTGGPIGIMGVPAPEIFGFQFSTPQRFFYFVFALLVIVYIIIRNITRSHSGRALEAIRDDEIAASYSAINIPKYKALCFGIGSFITGLAGAAMVSYTGYASPDNFTLDEGLILCQMAILGGLGSLPGSILGAAILIVVPELSRTAYEYRLLIMGLMMVILMLFCPNGLLGKNGLMDIIVHSINKLRHKSHHEAMEGCDEND
ncbi:branched-chain amino acid ABC transporter permease [Clostridium sp. KNHs216]|uniref:branched-chain amino acid ABC transporter permease n=1 Tax=Eubacteriales TaxID=186802 RepID=UPI001153E49A|nr:branched-chain amino acid ABC transporter permease [Clostridium sp. KNHs216]TQI66995.1 branched-chain amino acid transport system permease protein [Clostridium sp. KNHs216]